jgi:hypothetical protein
MDGRLTAGSGHRKGRFRPPDIEAPELGNARRRPRSHGLQPLKQTPLQVEPRAALAEWGRCAKQETASLPKLRLVRNSLTAPQTGLEPVLHPARSPALTVQQTPSNDLPAGRIWAQDHENRTVFNTQRSRPAPNRVRPVSRAPVDAGPAPCFLFRAAKTGRLARFLGRCPGVVDVPAGGFTLTA